MYQFSSKKTKKKSNWVSFLNNLKLGLHEKQVNNNPFETEDSESQSRSYLYYDPLDSFSDSDSENSNSNYSSSSFSSDIISGSNYSDIVTVPMMPASNYYFNPTVEISEDDVFVNENNVEESYRPSDCAHIKRETVYFRNREITAIFKVKDTNPHVCGRNFFKCEECLMACRILVKTPLHPTVKMFQSLHTWHYCSMYEAYFKYVVKLIARTDEIEYSDYKKQDKCISDLLKDFYF